LRVALAICALLAAGLGCGKGGVTGPQAARLAKFRAAVARGDGAALLACFPPGARVAGPFAMLPPLAAPGAEDRASFKGLLASHGVARAMDLVAHPPEDQVALLSALLGWMNEHHTVRELITLHPTYTGKTDDPMRADFGLLLPAAWKLLDLKVSGDRAEGTGSIRIGEREVRTRILFRRVGGSWLLAPPGWPR